MTRRLVPAFVLLLLLALAACSGDRATVSGTYRAVSDGTEILLTLDKDGKGTWSTDLDEIPFKWTLRADGTLWLHTREGGVITVETGKVSLRLRLPGTDVLVFVRK
jgi:hypothetical protein